MNAKIGVAISTTGDEHRLELLARCVARWRAALAEKNGWTSEGTNIFVTIDGDEAACQRVLDAVGYEPVQFYRVGQCSCCEPGSRQGVAVNKNTGLELLMDAGVEHLFLSDDDTWPLYGASLDKHIAFADGGILHSMVCWGKHRLDGIRHDPDPDDVSWAAWNWPRGVMLYVNRYAADVVGGMDERFGIGGHEHVEYSRRMHNALMTPDDFCTPVSYTTRNALGAAALWHCEDMPRPGEPLGNLRLRRRKLTTIKRTPGEWDRINRVMADQDGSAAFVSYQAQDNGRASATLCQNIPSQGAEESK